MLLLANLPHFNPFFQKAKEYGYNPVPFANTEWWSSDWVHCMTEGDYDFEKVAKCLFTNHAPIYNKKKHELGASINNVV